MSASPSDTLYQIADQEIRRCIEAYLRLAEASKGLTDLHIEHVADARTRLIVAAGFGLGPSELTADQLHDEWTRRQALQFDVETGITAGVYANMRRVAEASYDQLYQATDRFTRFDEQYLASNPHLLPLMQHLAGVFSKAKLKEVVGNVSDNSISRPAAARLAKLLSERVAPAYIVKGEILKRLESTLEGIVRDLVGRVLLESIVDAALRRRQLTFLREEQYQALAGVVYDFRADFVLPDADTPQAFIEVRKSSSRHASLYAKDKMFSAINWKGKTRDLLAILVVDGEWTGETLRVMANVFDYVVPIGRIDELTDNLAAYIAGDRSKLKWFIEFSIKPASSHEASDSAPVA